MMPTGNRHIFLRQAIKYVLRQTHENFELIIVDGGRRDFDLSHIKDDRIKYMRVSPEMSTGEKRNMACKESKGEFIFFMDDDDWQSPDRIERQIEVLKENDLVQTSHIYAYIVSRAGAILYLNPDPENFAHGAGCAFRRRIWEETPFDHINRTEDVDWIRKQKENGKKIFDMKDTSYYIYMLHGRNVSHSKSHQRVNFEITNRARELIGNDIDWYDDLTDILPSPRGDKFYPRDVIDSKYFQSH